LVAKSNCFWIPYISVCFDKLLPLSIYSLWFDLVQSPRVYLSSSFVWRVWRYQRGNQNPWIKWQTTRRTKEDKRTNNDLQNTTHKTWSFPFFWNCANCMPVVQLVVLLSLIQLTSISWISPINLRLRAYQQLLVLTRIHLALIKLAVKSRSD
jgi:hypothetical protein